MLPKFIIYSTICDILERDGRIMEAISCFRDMPHELTGDARTDNERAQWELGKCLGGILLELV